LDAFVSRSPELCFAPVESCRGTIPINAATITARSKTLGYGRPLAIVVAPKSRTGDGREAGYSPRSAMTDATDRFSIDPISVRTGLEAAPLVGFRLELAATGQARTIIL